MYRYIAVDCSGTLHNATSSAFEAQLNEKVVRYVRDNLAEDGLLCVWSGYGSQHAQVVGEMAGFDGLNWFPSGKDREALDSFESDGETPFLVIDDDHVLLDTFKRLKNCDVVHPDEIAEL